VLPIDADTDLKLMGTNSGAKINGAPQFCVMPDEKRGTMGVLKL